MARKSGHRIRLILALAALTIAPATKAWTADPQVQAASAQILPRIDRSSQSPDAPSSTIPAAYSPHADWRDAMADHCEDSSSPCGLFRHCPCFARHHRKKPLQTCYWFHYIRGEGPAIWVHD
jgi:hypothetical protein